MDKNINPKLRFKKDDWTNFWDWEEKELGDIWFFQTSSVDKLSKDWEEKVYLVNYMNVYRHESINNLTKNNLQVVTAKDSQILSNNLKKWDILFTPSSETPEDIWHSVVIFEDLDNCVYSYHLMRFRPKIKLNILYSHYFCNTSKVLSQLSMLSTWSTRFTISVKSFSSIKINLPTLQEQEKIAKFLSNIDKNINLLKEEKKQIQTYKKGIMQKIFNQEIRFKDENWEEFWEWEEKKLGEICDIIWGYAFKSNLLYKEEKEWTLPLVKISNINKFWGINVNSDKIQFYKYSDNLSKYLINKWDILTAMTWATVWKTCFSDKDNMLLNQRVACIKWKKIKQELLKWFLLTQKFYDYCQNIWSWWWKSNISTDNISNYTIYYPIDIKEQEKIAIFISNIYKENEILDKEIEKVEEYKKWVMQEIFM